MYTVSMNLQQYLGRYANTKLISATKPPAPRAVVWQWQVAGGSGRVRKEKKGRKKGKKKERNGV